MTPKFGTSGLRGLVSDLTAPYVRAHVQAFLGACKTGPRLCLGRDLRVSSPAIARSVAEAAQGCGIAVMECGALPTPALALAAAEADAAAVMVTGSHIPADRNGLKFYLKGGQEITKDDEAAILARLNVPEAAPAPGTLQEDPGAQARFVARYTSAFGATTLAGQRIGIWEHSAVGRDTLRAILQGLGAEVVPLGRSEQFIPVDTEAVDPAIRAQIADWVRDHRLDALVSTDGDSDRPLLADETGQVVPGDLMGQIAAEYLGAEVVVTPVSSNSGVLQKGFAAVRRTRIGSPYVIAGMTDTSRVVGYEANGGFLLGFAAQGPAGPLPPLMTRDCMLPLIATLVASAGSVSARVAAEPPVVTRAGRLQKVPTAQSQTLMARLTEDPATRANFLAPLGVTSTGEDLTDGLRLLLERGEVLHIRPSNNAPELRVYVEAGSIERAEALLTLGCARLEAEISRS